MVEFCSSEIFFFPYKYQFAMYIKIIDMPEKQNVSDSTFLPFLQYVPQMICPLNGNMPVTTF